MGPYQERLACLDERMSVGQESGARSSTGNSVEIGLKCESPLKSSNHSHGWAINGRRPRRHWHKRQPRETMPRGGGRALPRHSSTKNSGEHLPALPHNVFQFGPSDIRAEATSGALSNPTGEVRGWGWGRGKWASAFHGRSNVAHRPGAATAHASP